MGYQLDTSVETILCSNFKKINFFNKMKFSLAIISMVFGANVKPDAKRMSAIRAATEEIASGARSDGNALLIQQMLEFYLGFNGLSTDNAEAMLSYGCFCQLLV